MRGTDHESHGQCLTEETLTEYLEGGMDPAIKAASEVHLIACDNCRSELGYFMRVLEEDIQAGTSAELGDSESSDEQEEDAEMAGFQKLVSVSLLLASFLNLLDLLSDLLFGRTEGGWSSRWNSGRAPVPS